LGSPEIFLIHSNLGWFYDRANSVPTIHPVALVSHLVALAGSNPRDTQNAVLAGWVSMAMNSRAAAPLRLVAAIPAA
jgi:hypothetical protein